MAKRLMDEAREAFRILHYSHRRDMGADEIQQFLNQLANIGKVSASTQDQALSALLFLYKKVLKVELPCLNDIVRAQRLQREPIVLNRTERLWRMRLASPIRV